MADRFMSLKQFAEHIGRQPSYITKLKQTGRLALTKDGRVKVKASIQRIEETAGGRVDMVAHHAKARANEKPAPAPTEADAPESGSRIRAKELLLQYENKQLRVELDMRRGYRFETIAVQREAFELGAMIRAGVERVIDHTSPRLAASTGKEDYARLLHGEIKRLRSMFKRELPAAMRRLRDAGNKNGVE